MVKIGVLTSSRADFGVYLPLLKAFAKDSNIDFEIIAFGTHLSKQHGYTLNDILKEGFDVRHKISSIITNDSEDAIATSAALTSLKFADFWNLHKNDFDIVLCLGDRFEMFSAVIAGVPFGVKFAHLYGGDFSEGAIDNVYRDGMTHCSVMHFTSTEKLANRVKLMVNNYISVDSIGILSIEELENIELLSIEDFKLKWSIDLSLPSILITIHPETVSSENNIEYSKIVLETLTELQNKYQLIITMPNADTNGMIYREAFEKLKINCGKKIHLIENFGIQSYFTCMKYSRFMLGNTSSGISEAASFNKYFVNVGNRQRGRIFGSNIISVPFNKDLILTEVERTQKLGEYYDVNIYKKENAIELIISKLKALKE